MDQRGEPDAQAHLCSVGHRLQGSAQAHDDLALQEIESGAAAEQLPQRKGCHPALHEDDGRPGPVCALGADDVRLCITSMIETRCSELAPLFCFSRRQEIRGWLPWLAITQKVTMLVGLHCCIICTLACKAMCLLTSTSPGGAQASLARANLAWCASLINDAHAYAACYVCTRVPASAQGAQGAKH